MNNYQHPPVIFHRKFIKPRLIRYQVADPKRFKFLWNRYDTATIGAAIVIGKYCYGINWAKPVSEIVK
jgi:hypothetical protein